MRLLLGPPTPTIATMLVMRLLSRSVRLRSLVVKVSLAVTSPIVVVELVISCPNLLLPVRWWWLLTPRWLLVSLGASVVLLRLALVLLLISLITGKDVASSTG